MIKFWLASDDDDDDDSDDEDDEEDGELLKGESEGMEQDSIGLWGVVEMMQLLLFAVEVTVWNITWVDVVGEDGGLSWLADNLCASMRLASVLIWIFIGGEIRCLFDWG